MSTSDPSISRCRVLCFERDADPTGALIPLAVRMKLDLCSYKIGLDDWQTLSDVQKDTLQSLPAETPAQIAAFAQTLISVLEKTGANAPRPIASRKARQLEEWANVGPIPEAVSNEIDRCELTLDWQNLDRFSRYVFWHLARKADLEHLRQAFEELVA